MPAEREEAHNRNNPSNCKAARAAALSDQAALGFTARTDALTIWPATCGTSASTSKADR